MLAVAHCYAGYQFGHFAGQLGDGRAILLGEVCCPPFVSLDPIFFLNISAICFFFRCFMTGAHGRGKAV
jgi:hypothetical protein